MQSPPASPLHWNWEEGQAAILSNWICGAAKKRRRPPSADSWWKTGAGGVLFPRVRRKIYKKRNKTHGGHRVTQRQWNQSETSVFLRVPPCSLWFHHPLFNRYWKKTLLASRRPFAFAFIRVHLRLILAAPRFTIK